MKKSPDLLSGILGDEMQGRTFPNKGRDSLLEPTTYMSPNLLALYIQFHFPHLALANFLNDYRSSAFWPQNHEYSGKFAHHTIQPADEKINISEPPHKQSRWESIDLIPKLNIERQHLGAGQSAYEYKKLEIPGLSDLLSKTKPLPFGHYHKPSFPLK